MFAKSSYLPSTMSLSLNIPLQDEEEARPRDVGVIFIYVSKPPPSLVTLY
jgi:hypothetical protein